MASISTDTYAAIPQELKARPQWVLWRREKRHDKITKVPYNARTNRNAKSTDPETWSTFAEALEGLEVFGENDGIGFVFSDDDDLVGVDLDDCSEDGETVVHWAEEIISSLASYTEFSQSRKGVHTILHGKLPPYGRKHGPVEMYESGRFFAMTGYYLPSSPATIQDRPEVLLSMHEKVFGPPPAPETPRRILPSENLAGDDWAVIDRVRKNPKYNDLWNGVWKGYGYPTESEADLGLVGYIAFFAGPDPARIDRIFRQSGKMRSKWDDPQHGRTGSTFGADTIDKALAGKTEFFDWRTEKKKPHRSQNGSHPPDPPEGDLLPTAEGDHPIHETDMGNGTRFALQFRGTARYTEGHGWLIYEEGRWVRDQLAAQELAKEIPRALRREAAAIKGDPKRAERLFIWGLKSEEDRRIQSALRQARSEPGIGTRAEEFDQQPWLFNCSNGTLDLAEGVLLPHDPAHLLTHMTPVAYDAEASCPKFEAFVLEIMNGRTELVGYLQRWLGHCLVGTTGTQELLFCHGFGANGKNTLLELVQAAMGDYADVAPKDWLMERKFEAHTQEIVSLMGKRFVVAEETGQGQQLNENFLKQITGSGELKGRFMRQNDIKFRPEFKVVLMTNHKPIIKGTDYAFWRRLPLVPFDVTFYDPSEERSPVKDPTLPGKLRVELPGILTWLVKGCRQWAEEGQLIHRPKVVVNASNEYRDSMDLVGQFIAERCRKGRGLSERAKLLYDAYVRWLEQNGHRAVSSNRFAESLSERGFVKEKREAGISYLDITLEEEEVPLDF